MLSLTSVVSLIPYLLVAAFGFRLAKRGETYASTPDERGRDQWFAGIATLYTVFMIYAGGTKFLLLSAILYAPGTGLYIWARREQGQTVFTTVEWIIFAFVLVGAVAGIGGLLSGYISI
jgi:arginine:ornithine antiporter/lysine permease